MISLTKKIAWFAVLTAATLGVAQSPSTPTYPLQVNQTEGFSKGEVVVFSYLMNFHCTHEPFADLDHNGKVAAVDPDEFQRPRCVAGIQPGLDPAGKPIDKTATLYVLVPFFDADNDGEAATPELAAALKQLFGFVPDAFDPTPGVPVQCPEPGGNVTQQKGAFGTCTMHASMLDLGPVLSQLGVVPAGTAVQVPTPNHSHLISQPVSQPIWWQIKSVLVRDRSAWPAADGSSGITSIEALHQAQAANQASADVPTNFFLFFGSQKTAQK